MLFKRNVFCLKLILCSGCMVSIVVTDGLGGRFKNAYELLNLRALKISMLYKNHIFQCMG